MKHSIILPCLVTAFVALSPAAAAFAAPNPSGTGQPNQSAEEQPFEPHGFTTNGFEHATTQYAGSQPQNSKNPKAVSQYDVAAFQFSSRPGATQRP